MRGLAKLSPGNIEMVVILCKKKTDCGYFSKIVPGLLCLGVRIRLCTSYPGQSEDATPGTETNRAACRGNLVRRWAQIGVDVLSNNCWLILPVSIFPL